MQDAKSQAAAMLQSAREQSEQMRAATQASNEKLTQEAMSYLAGLFQQSEERLTQMATELSQNRQNLVNQLTSR